MQISGDEDEVRLRILANAHSYKVGDRPSVKIHWRERPSLALVTFPGRAGARLPLRQIEDRCQRIAGFHDARARRTSIWPYR